MKALIIAGEASGDLHAGALANALKERIPDLQISGIGGDRLKAAGAQLLYHYRDIAVVGVVEVLSKLPSLRKAFSRVVQWARQEQPDFVVLVDFPDFNFRLARALKKLGVQIFYFISPQIWAWRKDRVHFLRDHVSLMITILPFEEKLYRSANVPVVYVGHPLVDLVRDEVSRQAAYVPSRRPLVGIMPGSRDVEVRRHLSVLSETVVRIRQQLDIASLLVWAPWLEERAYGLPNDIDVVKDNRYAAMQACDLMLVASGTSTLEAAILKTPLFIVYRVGHFAWQLGKVLVRVPYYGLVNWIAEQKCIPEYIQEQMNPELLACDAIDFPKDETRKADMRGKLDEIVAALGPPGAIHRAADAILSNLK